MGTDLFSHWAVSAQWENRSVPIYPHLSARISFPGGQICRGNREHLSSFLAAIKFATAATISVLTTRFATGASGWSRRRSVALVRFPPVSVGRRWLRASPILATGRLSRVATCGGGAGSGCPAYPLASSSAPFCRDVETSVVIRSLALRACLKLSTGTQVGEKPQDYTTCVTK